MNNSTTTQEFVNSLTPKLEAKEVEAKWYHIGKKFRLKRWQSELKKIITDKNLELPDLAESIGSPRSENPKFYTSLPKSKETYVKIGLILQQPRETVDRWIKKNTKGRMLYEKDPKDFISIWFLKQNMKEKNAGSHYCKLYLEALTELKNYKEKKNSSDETAPQQQFGTIEVKAVLENIKKPEECMAYIKNNKSTFQHADERARSYINNYIKILLKSASRTRYKGEDKWTVLTLREKDIITPAQYNYLTGKNQPLRKKSSLISIALDLGMGAEQIDELLRIGGFDGLNINDDAGFAEIALIYLLSKWEQGHTEVLNWRSVDDKSIVSDERMVVEQILDMRKNIVAEFNRNYKGYKFPF